LPQRFLAIRHRLFGGAFQLRGEARRWVHWLAFTIRARTCGC
jgi:hypothetical protein